MASVNQCNFIGNLGRDPEINYLPSGDSVANMSIACTEKWKDKATGETKEQTEWVRLVAFGKKAELAGEYLKKGSSIWVQTRVRTRKWQDKDGQDRYSTEFVIDNMQFLCGKQESGGSDSRAQHQAESYQRSGSSPSQSNEQPAFNDMDCDIPF